MTTQNEFGPFEVGSCFDDFDGDLLRLVPGLGQTPDWELAKMARLYTVGSADLERMRMMHPATWNGFGAVFWTSAPPLTRDAHGWLTLPNSCTSDAPVLIISVATAIRDAWVHHYRANLDGRHWFSPFPEMMNLLWHARGSSLAAGDREEIRAYAMDWAMTAVESAAKVAKSGEFKLE